MTQPAGARGAFLTRGFLTFAAEPSMLAWVEAARPHAKQAARDPGMAQWLRCGGTWFVGLDALPNDAAGHVAGGPPLSGAATDFIRHDLGLSLPLHRAQLSICYPGYPRPSAEETEQAFNFRLKRDAAHVDGLLAEGPQKRRYLKEPHAYVLGVTLTAHDPDAAPLTVWEGSHLIMQQMFAAAFNGAPAEDWPTIDVTAAYQAARKSVFETCRRVQLPSSPGETVVVHRHALHGVAPWGEAAPAAPDGRMIAYFRPEFPDISSWLNAP